MNRIKKYLLAVFLLAISSTLLLSQEKNRVNQGQYWLSYTINKKISPKWNTKISIADRRYFVNNRNHMFYILGDATFKLNKSLSLTGGFMYFNLHRPSNPHSKIQVTQPEFRPYQKVSYRLKTGAKASLSFGLTIEERIRMRIVDNQRQGEYFTYLRFRNKVYFKYQISKKEARRPLFAYVYDDFMLHYGSTVKGNPFDQNRLGVGMEWKASRNFSLKTEYIYWHQEIANSNTVFDRNIINLSLVQNL
ncbi:MAG: DUF2490 domain-containing protein [Cyclobacteriaceae bacterium]